MCFAFLPFTKNSKFGLTFIQGRWHWILSHSPLVIWRGTPVISGGTPGGSKINYFIYWVFIICHVSQNVVSPDLEIQGNLSYNEYWCHCRSAGQEHGDNSKFKLWLNFRSFSVFWRVIQSIWMCQCTSVPIFCSNVPEDDARWKLHWSAKLWRLASTPAPVLAQFPCLLVATFILIKKIRI